MILFGAFFVYAWAVAAEGHPLSPRLLSGFDAFIAVFFVAGGAFFVLVPRTPVLGCRLDVNPEGMTVYYRTGKVRSFRWADPQLDLRLFDRIIPPDRPTAGRRVSFWGDRSDATSIPLDLFEGLLTYLPTLGITVTEYPGLALGSMKYRFTRGPRVAG